MLALLLEFIQLGKQLAADSRSGDPCIIKADIRAAEHLGSNTADELAELDFAIDHGAGEVRDYPLDAAFAFGVIHQNWC
jgi:hypothetical protein